MTTQLGRGIADALGGEGLQSSSVYLDIGTDTATHPDTVSGAATINKVAGIVTTNADVNSAAGAIYTLTLGNTLISASSIVLASVTTTGAGTPTIAKVTPGSESCVIVVQNIHSANAFNAALKISFVVFKSLTELA